MSMLLHYKPPEISRISLHADTVMTAKLFVSLTEKMMPLDTILRIFTFLLVPNDDVCFLGKKLVPGHVIR